MQAFVPNFDLNFCRSSLQKHGKLDCPIDFLMELHQGGRNKSEQKAIGKFVRELNFEVLPIDANISHRACIYVEEFCLQAAMQKGDALIAATAVERGETLCTANHKHYKAVSELDIKRFKP